MRYIVIGYDATNVCVVRLKNGQEPLVLTCERISGNSVIQFVPYSKVLFNEQEVLCQGSSFGDVIESLKTAFSQEGRVSLGEVEISPEIAEAAEKAGDVTP